jgi:hypothetical protein
MLTFPDLLGSSLRDGNYRLAVRGARITDAAGNSLTIPVEWAAGPDVVFHFFRYYGDLDGDRDVDFLDLYPFQRAMNSQAGQAAFRSELDYDGDGSIAAADLNAYRGNYLTFLAPP